MRRIRPGKKPYRLGGCVEMLIGNVERYREYRSGTPLEGLFEIAFKPNGRRAAPFVNVNDGLVDMMLRFGLFTRWDLADVRVGFLLLAKIEIAAERSHSGPRLDLDIH